MSDQCFAGVVGRTFGRACVGGKGESGSKKADREGARDALSFHGAAGGVTGSCHLVTCGRLRVLVDCGLFQGGHELHEDNAGGSASSRPHRHHAPHACASGPLRPHSASREARVTGEIICTAATRDLTRLVLLDSAHLHEEEARRRRHHRTGIGREPLYDTMDALEVLRPVRAQGQLRGAHRPRPRGRQRPSSRQGIFSARPASARGDRGRDANGHPLLGRHRPGEPAAPEHADPPADADIIVMETTYGDRDHRSFDASVKEFHDAIRKARCARRKCHHPDLRPGTGAGAFVRPARRDGNGEDSARSQGIPRLADGHLGDASFSDAIPRP